MSEGNFARNYYLEIEILFDVGYVNISTSSNRN